MCRKQIEVNDKTSSFMILESRRQGITQGALVDKAMKIYQARLKSIEHCNKVRKDRHGY